MDNKIIISNLKLLISKCLSNGFVKVQRLVKDNGVITIYSPNWCGSGKVKTTNIILNEGNDNDSMNTLLINSRKVCWVTPIRSNNNLKKIDKVLSLIEKGWVDKRRGKGKGKDKDKLMPETVYPYIVPMRNGNGYIITLHTILGKVIHRARISLFSINIGPSTLVY